MTTTPPPTPQFNPQPEPPTSEKAKSEAAALAEGNLRRYNSLRTHLHMGGLVVFWFAIVVACVLFLILAWHLGAPSGWRFLSHDEENRLQTVLFSAMGSSLVTGIARKWLDPKK